MRPYDRAADTDRPDDSADKWVTPHGVTVSAPSGKAPYYRLEWVDADGRRRQSSGRRTFAYAWAKACEQDRLQAAGATPKTELPAAAGIDYWLDLERPTPKNGWGHSHRKNMKRYAEYYFRPGFGRIRHQDLRRKHIQAAINAAPNRSEGDNVRRAASSLLAAMRQGEFLLESQVLTTDGLFWHGTTPVAARREEAAVAGEDVSFVPRHKRPSAEQVRALREAAETVGRRVWWRGLMVELAAGSGVREGELWALDLIATAEPRVVKVDWQVEEDGGQHLERPKGNKRRTTIYREVTETGYELAAAMERRRAEVEEEMAAGTNPNGLLFPTRAGTWMRSGNFHRDVFEPAALAAGFTFTERRRPHRGRPGGFVTVRDWDLPWHALRHHFCTVALESWALPDTIVSELAGHSSSDFTRKRYVSGAEDTVKRALELTA